MTYPRIFSLSTVGILKHYVHDYFFHSLRTDFIGPNGVGKSIIADLLQLIFVYDTSLIRFGTDGVKKDDRSIYTLPYNQATAYCFLNLEVNVGQYLIIGIAISSQVGSRITPFVISRSPELEKEMSDLSMAGHERLRAVDFIKDDHIQDLRSLTTRLLSERGLYLSYFRTKEDTKRYYQFLYEKHILSINLSVEEHLNAFAKVIQSFSKAKSLDLSPAKASKSLKEFLFDDSDDDLEGEYLRQQAWLEKLLRDFADLDNYIDQLRKKQAGLLTLKKLDEEQLRAFKAQKTAELARLYRQMRDKRGTETELMNRLEKEKQLKTQWEEALTDFPAKKLTLKKALDTAKSFGELYLEYDLLVNREIELQQDLTSLKLLQAPNLTEAWYQIHDISEPPDLNPSEYKDLIKTASPYFSRFATPFALDQAFSDQRDDMAALSQDLKKKELEMDQFIDILRGKDGDSTLGWGLRQGKDLTKTQQALLLHFARRPTHQPKTPKAGDSYVDVPALLQSVDKNIDAEALGFWVHLGPLHEYLSHSEITELFSKGNSVQTINELLKKLAEDKAIIVLQLEALDAASKAKSYNHSILTQSFDLFLVNYAGVETIKKAARCIYNLSWKIAQLEKELQALRGRIKDTKLKLPTEISYDEPEVVKRELNLLYNQALENYTNCCTEESTLNSNKSKSELDIKTITNQLRQTTSELLGLQNEWNSLLKQYFDTFGENLDEQMLTNAEILDMDKYNFAHQEASKDYQVHYRDLVGNFPETSSGKHAAVNRELSEKIFDFRTLESALLGLKIKHTDEIAPVLEEANRNRMTMADNIKSTMVRIFDRTLQTYKQYKDLIYTLNGFFHGVKISDRFYFGITFSKNETVKIDLLEEISAGVRNAVKRGELPFDKPVGEFIEEFFRRTAQLKEKVPINKLLDPKTFFELSVSLTDEKRQGNPGSTGETYSAIALLGIARLSLVQKEKRGGLRFIILEELGSLDASNFNTFPAIAKEFDYQIVTMAPTPFRSVLDDEWYAHHLIKGLEDPNINYHPSASYFKTKAGSQELENYLKLEQA